MTVITYSKNVFLPLTNACRNACAYCGFRSDAPTIMERREVLTILKSGRKAGATEALFTFGEQPESFEHIKKTLRGWGYESMTEYLLDLCRDAIKIGLLPHTNSGVIRKEEMKALKGLVASMGLMLENSSRRLCEKGMPHEKSPGKIPGVRLKTMEDAGKLKIPFTTGLLIGIGETEEEVLHSIEKIKKVSDRYGHIQEVIVQNFKPKKGTIMERCKEPALKQMANAVKAVRQSLPDMHIQVPPNLNPDRWPKLLSAGIDDLGGISHVTKDYINPEAEWPDIERLSSISGKLGITLRERLAIYPEFIKKGWYSEEIGELIGTYTDKEGLVIESGRRDSG